jgi:DNA-binding CsgD family transcriptional regulator
LAEVGYLRWWFSAKVVARATRMTIRLDHRDGPRLERAPHLTKRQLECLVWAEEGKSARDIGQILGISQRTVEDHLALACAALDVRTRVQAVVKARRLGLLE